MPRLYPALFLLLLLFGFAAPTLAQPFSFGDGPTVSTCSRTFVDLGGSNGGHGNSGSTQTITICSTQGNGTGIILNFVELEINGVMALYNGTTATGDPLAVLDNNSTPLIVQTTEPNPSGCMTVTFDASGNGPGWVATVDCAIQCQPIEAVLLSASPAPDAEGYINICPGDEVNFTGSGNYPAAGTAYEQSDATSEFFWNFQDGNTAVGPNVSNIFEEPGGYIVELTITDRRGCTNSNRISQRVRVAPPPKFLPPIDFPESVCVDEAVSITTRDALIPSPITVVPVPDTIPFTTQQSRTDTIALPDGVGVAYTSPLIYQIFDPGQRLENLDQLVAVCANLEHSYLGDLDIWLTCPNGSRVDLVRSEADDGVRFIRLGEGVRATLDTPDEGAVYCWTPTAPITMDRWVNDNNPVDPRPNVGGLLQPGNYAPEGNFNNLLGCDLNGRWEINFIDNLGTDQGYIFSWELVFTAETYPVPEEFSVPLVDVSWVPTNNLAFYAPDSIVYQPRNPGSSLLRLRSTDEYGCAYDTTYSIGARSPFDPDCSTCGPLVDRTALDTSVCAGTTFQPGVVTESSNDTLVTWEFFGDAPISNELFPNQNRALELPIDVSFQEPGRLTNAPEEIAQICVNVDNPNDDLSDLILEVIAPNGRVLTLIRNLGGVGDDLQQTCFSPTATLPVSSGSPPYTGVFQPFSGGWTNFNNSDVNGQWILRAYDTGGAEAAVIVSWDITFRYRPDLTYVWSPAAGLSCTDCPDPVITADQARSYTLEVTDSRGCTDQATVTVAITELDIDVTAETTPPGCPNENSGSIALTVTGSEPSYNYRWSDGPTDQDRFGLAAGDYIVTISDSGGCEEVFSYTLTDPVVAGLTIDRVMAASCAGAADGEIELTPTGGSPPFTFRWTAVLVDGTVVFNDPQTEDIGALTAGAYTVLATDSRGCQATETITIDQPDELQLDFRAYDVTCLGSTDGRVRVIPTGGDGNYTYNWQTGSAQDSIFGLPNGDYRVTVTDGQGCEAAGSGLVNEPAEIMTITVAQDQLGCNEVADNVATVTALGGYGNYVYVWSNGETAATATQLPAGPASVTVTDAGGCERMASLNIAELPPIAVEIILNPPSCNGAADGAVGARPSGGAGTTDTDYTFLWSTGAMTSAITGVAGGQTYSVTVTDGRGCTGTAERFLPTQVPITFILEETPVDCNGAATGGLSIREVNGPISGTYRFEWAAAAGSATTPAVSNLPAGQYRVRISDEIDQCSIDTLLTITEPASLGGELTQDNVGCFGDSDGRLAFAATGGVGGYRYDWSDGSSGNVIQGLSAGTYTLTVTDANGCTLVNTYTITQPDILVATASATAPLCFGENTGQLILAPQGGRPPFSYSIDNRAYTRNPNFQALPAMDYVIYVRDSSGCTANAAVTIPQGPTFSIELGEDLVVPFGDSVVLMADIEGGVGDLRYDWRGAFDGTLSCTDCPDPVATPPYAIDYTLTVTDENGCEDVDQLRVTVPKVREVAVPTGFSPNQDGVNDRLIVHGRPGTQVVQFSVFDRWGSLLFEDVDYPVNDVTRGWDGDADGQPVNAGVYFYRLVIRYEDDSTEILTGETTVVR